MECNKVERQECRQIPRQECEQVARQECRDVPSQVPRQECSQVGGDWPWRGHVTTVTGSDWWMMQVPRQECKQVPREVCEQVAKQVCNQVPRENCRDIPREVGSSASKSSIRRFVIMEKAHTRAFSWLKAATTAFTFKTLC